MIKIANKARIVRLITVVYQIRRTAEQRLTSQCKTVKIKLISISFAYIGEMKKLILKVFESF